MRKKNDEASALWVRFYNREITIAEYKRSFPVPILLHPHESTCPPFDVPSAYRERWVANETTVWEPDAA